LWRASSWNKLLNFVGKAPHFPARGYQALFIPWLTMDSLQDERKDLMG